MSTTQAYSHGLEDIYAIETIDLATVRAMGETTIEAVEDVEVQDLWDGQYWFDLGSAYQDFMKPILLKVAIQELGLSVRAEMALIKNQIYRLEDLRKYDLNKLGQGHQDEIQRSFKEYTKGKSLERSYVAEFGSLLRSLATGNQRKSYIEALKPFGLQYLIHLSPCEKMNSEPAAWQDNGLGSYLLREIVQVFVEPFARERGGILFRHEMLEYLEDISDIPDKTEAVLNFLGFKLPFYCVDMELYDLVRQTAKSYFYSCGLEYELRELVSLIIKELGKKWIYADRLFIQKVLMQEFDVFREVGRVFVRRPA